MVPKARHNTQLITVSHYKYRNKYEFLWFNFSFCIHAATHTHRPIEVLTKPSF